MALPVTLIISTYRPRPMPVHKWIWNIARRSQMLCGRCSHCFRNPASHLSYERNLIPALLQQAFQDRFGNRPHLYRAPGRVNLIGEHTDYNDGFVMPTAVEFATWAAVAPRAGRTLVVHSENFGETCELDLDYAAPKRRGHWSDYVLGVAVMLERDGFRLAGANLLIASDVPVGAGLSSSAALEVAVALALAPEPIERTALAKLCQRAEHEFAGVKCGIMDQFIACHARAGTALLLDCRSLEYSFAPLPFQARSW